MTSKVIQGQGNIFSYFENGAYNLYISYMKDSLCIKENPTFLRKRQYLSLNDIIRRF